MRPKIYTELQNGIINYPILYIPHFHHKFILTEIEEICEELFIDEGGDNVIEVIGCTSESLFPDDTSSTNKTKYIFCTEIVEQLANFLNPIFHKPKKDQKKEICVIKNVTAELLKDSRFCSLLHQFAEYYDNRNKGKNTRLTIILCVPSCELPPSNISGISYVVNILPPSKEEIKEEIKSYWMKSDDASLARFARSLQGLHLYDVRQIIQSTINTYGYVIKNNSIKWAQEQKQQLVRKTGILEVIEPDVCLNDVGGLSKLKDKVVSISRIYKNIDLLPDRIPLPKGFLLLGMPGCGKSMIAKATAKEFDCPLIKLDMGKLLGKYVGDSDHNLQLALDVVDSAHPCVLWIDEIEKAFAGTNNVAGDGDAVMMRLMGKFLSWMQERSTAVFIMATANDVLKPELMRKGRFDEVFFIDFPTVDEANQIIEKTIKKYISAKGGIKFLDILDGDDNEYRSRIAEEMVGPGRVRQDLKHGLSGAEIKSVIDTFVVDTISEEIKNAKEKKRPVNLGNISFNKDLFNDAIRNTKEHAMILQAKENKRDKDDSFIDKIYTFQDKFKFQQASEIK